LLYSRDILLLDTVVDSEWEEDAGKTAMPVSVLVAVVDAANLKGSFGTTKVEAYCNLRTTNWEGGLATSIATEVNRHMSFNNGYLMPL
jgi:hypothetical protein